MKSYSIEEINGILNGSIVGSVLQKITAPEQLEVANESEISFIGNKKYEKLWANSKAGVAVVNEDISIEPGENRAFIKVKNADLAMSQILALFAPPMPVFNSDIHPTAVVDETAIICNGVRIGAGCYIGPKVVLGDNTTIYPNVTILDDSTIGKNTTIWSGTVIRERCHIGNDCIIHPNATIGADGFGFNFAMAVLNGGRIGIASQALGIATGAYELALKYSQERKAFGKEIFKHQAIAFKLVDMATQIMAAKLLVLKAASEKDEGKDISQSGAMAKLFASQVAMDTTIESVQIHGGNGYVSEYHVERMMRDAKITQIYEGTSEIQRIVISRTLVS